MTMNKTEIKRSTVAKLKEYAKEKGVDVDGMTRAQMIETILDEREEEQTDSRKKPNLVRMVNEDGKFADVAPSMVTDYAKGGYREV